MNRTKAPRRAAFTLVEVIAATAIMAALAASSFAIVRTAHRAWTRHHDDSAQRQEAIAALQHIVRQVRQAEAVTAISAPSNASGNLSVLKADGTTAAWSHDGAARTIRYGAASPGSALAEGITELKFVGLTANGLTQTTDPDLVHMVWCGVKYDLARPAGTTTESVSCLAWLRAW